MWNNIPRGVVRCAGNVPANVVDVADQGSQPPGCVEHPDGCSATRVAPRSTRTHTRLDDDLRSPIQRRWRKQTSETKVAAARRRAYSGDIPNPVQTPNKGSPLIGGRNRERDLQNLSVFFWNFLC